MSSAVLPEAVRTAEAGRVRRIVRKRCRWLFTLLPDRIERRRDCGGSRVLRRCLRRRRVRSIGPETSMPFSRNVSVVRGEILACSVTSSGARYCKTPGFWIPPWSGGCTSDRAELVGGVAEQDRDLGALSRLPRSAGRVPVSGARRWATRNRHLDNRRPESWLRSLTRRAARQNLPVNRSRVVSRHHIRARPVRGFCSKPRDAPACLLSVFFDSGPGGCSVMRRSRSNRWRRRVVPARRSPRGSRGPLRGRCRDRGFGRSG